jgi:DNA-binding LytR/AlgR family response regulator
MKKILVIEDEKILRENIKILLNEEGYEVVVANNGTRGIESAKIELPDLIICDIMMPGIDGYDVIKELSAGSTTKSIPFIFLTAKVAREDIRLGMNLGADDYLSKPFRAEELLKSIEARFRRIERLKADFTGKKEEQSLENLTMEDKIFINVNNKPFLIKINEILFIAAENQYTSLRLLDGKTYLLRKSVSKWEEILPKKFFLRIHRSTIINIDYMIKMEKWYNSSFLIYLKNVQEPFSVSKKYSSKIRENTV